MKPSRLRTLLIGLTAGVAYAFLSLFITSANIQNVSVAYVFVLPLVMGTIPVLLSTKEQLKSYWTYLLLPIGIVMTFFLLAIAFKFEGMICLIIIIAPFLLLGTVGAFIFRIIKLKNEGTGTKLYTVLLLPFIVMIIENNCKVTDSFHTVKTSIAIDADKATVWEHVKNVRNIQPSEIKPHFVHLIGIPKPLNGELHNGIRSITWEKGIKFQEVITSWDNGNGFSYDINVDPASIPPTTLDEHVMIGGKYFDVVEGSYHIDSISSRKSVVTLMCKYRITTSLNFYSKLWADFILDDFNNMILEVIKKRSEGV